MHKKKERTTETAPEVKECTAGLVPQRRARCFWGGGEGGGWNARFLNVHAVATSCCPHRGDNMRLPWQRRVLAPDTTPHKRIRPLNLPPVKGQSPLTLTLNPERKTLLSSGFIYSFPKFASLLFLHLFIFDAQVSKNGSVSSMFQFYHQTSHLEAQCG